MGGPSLLVQSRPGVHVREEGRRPSLGLDKNVGVLEVGPSAKLGDVAVHDHGSDAAAGLVREAVAIAVAVRRVAVRTRIGRPIAKVLDTHEILLPVHAHIVPRDVIGVVEQPPADGRNEVAILFLVPVDLESGLPRCEMRKSRSNYV